MREPIKQLIILAIFLAGCSTQAGAPSTALPTVAPQATATNPPTATSNSQPATATPPPLTAEATTESPISDLQSLTPTAVSESSIVNLQSSIVYTQLTTGGCCVQPFFSPDGSRVLYLDKPSADAPTGLWGVTTTQPLAAPPLAAPAFFSARLGPFNADMSLNAFLENGRTVVERAADGQQWVIDNGGRRVLFSPDNTRIAWVVSEESGNFDVRKGDVYLANVDGSDPRLVISLYGGGVQGWFHDSARMLVSGKANRSDVTSTLSILNLADGSLTKLIDVERSRAMLISPDDRTLAYYVSQATDESQDGMYLLDLTKQGAQPMRVDFFGAYRWCSANALYYIPMQPDAPSQSLWRFDVTTLQSTPVVTASADSPFHISNGDWDLARDGAHVVYVNASDHNIWLVTLPQAC